MENYYLSLHHDDRFSGLKKANNLPFGDESYFTSGFLVNSPLNEEGIKQTDYLAGQRSRYYLGQTLLEDHEPKADEEFSLLDKGYYIVTLSGPGYDNTDNHSKFEGEWEKLPIKDVLTIKDDFTWERRKEIDFDFFLKWNGTYSYIDNLLVFSLSKQGYKGSFFSGINDIDIKNYGLMYGPIIDTHMVSDRVKAEISGLISDNVSGMIYKLFLLPFRLLKSY
ncbi:hypothetical protein AGMMS50267_17230 [Spirochaetia bacterium]|nr:hypothetical protein AGMMS50267_17230 [Spirochaetia bacterium]